MVHCSPKLWKFHKNQKLGTYLINVIDENDEKIAMMMGTVYRKKEENKMFV